MKSTSDSVAYFERPQYDFNSWSEAYDTGTLFIEFVGYPFINFFHFTYEMIDVAIFHGWGFLGLCVFSIFFFKEKPEVQTFL